MSSSWHQESNYLGQFSVENEDELWRLLDKAERKGIRVVPFFEPDIDNQLTAIALEPTKESKRLTSNLPLMLREFNQMPLEHAA